MSIRLFLVGAIVLIVFMIIAAAATDGLCLGVQWPVWLGASLLSFYVDLLFGGPGWVNGAFGRTTVVQPGTPVA